MTFDKRLRSADVESSLHSVDPAVVSGHLHYLREPHKKTPEGGSNRSTGSFVFSAG